MGFPGNGEGSNVEVCSIVEVYMGVPQAGTPGKNHGRRWQVASCQSAFYPFSPILVAYTRTHTCQPPASGQVADWPCRSQQCQDDEDETFPVNSGAEVDTQPGSSMVSEAYAESAWDDVGELRMQVRIE